MNKLDFFGQNIMYDNNKDNYLQIIGRVLGSESLLRGASIENLERNVAELCNRKFAICVNSGTDALFVSLKSFGIKPDDEIIVTAFSFVASATPILMLGAKPVFIDINPETCITELELIEQKITPKTKGVIIVDIFGECPDYQKIRDICAKHNLFYLEDAAQAFGSSYNSRKAGNLGDVSTFSFDVSKVVYGLSTGGIILTDDEKVFNQAKLIRGHGFNPIKRDFVQLGINSQMSSVNAALINYRIKCEPEYFEKRQEVRRLYDSYLSNIDGVSILKRNPNSTGNNHKYVIFVDSDKRQQLIDFLATKSIPTKVHYDKALPEYDILSKYAPSIAEYQNAHDVSRKILSLPIHAFLDKSDVKYICEAIQEFYNGN